MRLAAALTLALLAVQAAHTKADDVVITGNSHLASMHEPSLWRSARKIEIYRLLWLRSFDAPMAFRWIVKADGTSELVTKKTDGQGGYEPGTLVLNRSTQIDVRETRDLLVALTRLSFWDLPADEGGELGLDGSQWFIEGVKDGKYHQIKRWNGGEIKSWALLLMRKSGEDLGPIY
jgi:hypothetical protein